MVGCFFLRALSSNFGEREARERRELGKGGRNNYGISQAGVYNCLASVQVVQMNDERDELN